MMPPLTSLPEGGGGVNGATVITAARMRIA